MQKRIACAFMLATVVSFAAAEAPYFGRWKANPSKGDMGSTQLTYSRVGGDELQETQDGKSYKFKVDGKPYPIPPPVEMTAAWKQVDSNTWEVTYRKNGNVVAIDTTKLSADGNTLSTTSKTVESKDVLGGSIVLHRTGGGPGLLGTWKGTPVLDSFILEVLPYQSDGLIFRVPDRFETKALFDGKPHPMTGPMASKGSTAAFTKSGPRSFETKQLTPGEPPMTATVTVSSDGKTLTEVAQIGALKRTWVFDRQP